MLLARMIYFFLPSHMVSSIPASVLAIIFVSLDFVSFVIQLTGGSYAGPTAPLAMQMKGVHIYMGGIGLQQFFILIFLGLAIKFHLEMSWLEHQNMAKPEWKRLLFTIYGCLAFITVGFQPESEQCITINQLIHRSVSSSALSSSLAARRLRTLFLSTNHISMPLRLCQ
jgi:hypothetical protein